jgi:hypothetical protein
LLGQQKAFRKEADLWLETLIHCEETACSLEATGDCVVDYQWATQCGQSIIGGVNQVFCEIAQENARSACRGGQPYEKTYNCN